MTTIAILGANGRLGRTVARAFLDAGLDVIAVSRSGKPLAELSGARFVAADASKSGDLIKATAGADIIFNGLNPLYTEWEEKVLPMARNVIEACKANGATMLFPGNVYGYGADMPEALTETTPEHPTTRKGEIRVEMEAMFRAAVERDGVQTIILRAGDFFGGTGHGTWLDLGMVTKLDKGIFTHPGDPDVVHAFAYLPDLAEAFVLVAKQRVTLPQFEAINFEGHNVSTAEMQLAVERAIGRPLKRGAMPWAFIKLAGLVWPMGREIARMSYLWQRPHRLVSAKFARLIGKIPHTPLDQAMRQALIDQNLLQDETRLAA